MRGRIEGVKGWSRDERVLAAFERAVSSPIEPSGCQETKRVNAYDRDREPIVFALGDSAKNL
jgi:hypothetical protein